MRLITFLTLLPLTFAAAAPERLPLWPEGAPGAKGQTDNDQPRIEIYRPAKERANGAAIVICPSNPWLSVDPVLAVPGLLALLVGLAMFTIISQRRGQRRAATVAAHEDGELAGPAG